MSTEDRVLSGEDALQTPTNGSAGLPGKDLLAPPKGKLTASYYRALKSMYVLNEGSLQYARSDLRQT